MTNEEWQAVLDVMDRAIDAGLYLDEINGEVVIATGMKDVGTDGEVLFVPFDED